MKAEQLAELRAIAEAAQQENVRVVGHPSIPRTNAFRAAADPPTVLALIDALAAARALNEKITCAWCGHEDTRNEGWPERMVVHLEACDKNPTAIMWRALQQARGELTEAVVARMEATERAEAAEKDARLEATSADHGTAMVRDLQAEVQRLREFRDRALYDDEAVCEADPKEDCTCSGCHTARARLAETLGDDDGEQAALARVAEAVADSVPLPPDAARVLHDNLWDLLGDDDDGK